VDEVRFQELQYLTLRKEIEDSLNRSFQIMVGGATLIPILVGILGHYAATPILLTLPMMVVVVALLYLNQWNSIMRCGRYIRTRIEPQMMGDQGWEAWLESHPDTHIGAVHNRLVDTYLVYAFYLLTAAYYFATSFIAVNYAHKTYGAVGEWVTFGADLAIGIAMGYIVLERVPTHTTTKREREFTTERELAKERERSEKKTTHQTESPVIASPSTPGGEDGTLGLALGSNVLGSNAPAAVMSVAPPNESTPPPSRSRRSRKRQ
jgi:hypothetical protein